MQLWLVVGRQLLSYMLVGSTVTLFEFALYNLILLIFPTTLPLLLTLYSVSSYGLSVALGFRWHRRWTFRDTRRQRKIFRRFVFLNALTLGLNAVVVLLCTMILPVLFQLDTLMIANMSKGVATLISGGLNFLGNRIWVFQATAIPVSLPERNKVRSNVFR